ncbi:unnamed protein product [Effrenium voratum]|nr:unnamed protein product [Effrenium voratum]
MPSLGSGDHLPGARDVARPAFPRANPGGEAEKMRIARYEKEEEAMAVVKKAEEEAKDDPDGTSEEKTKAYGILFAYALAFIIPFGFFAVVLLGIWTPGTEIDRGISKNSPNYSMGAISRYDDEMDKLRKQLKNQGPKEY